MTLKELRDKCGTLATRIREKADEANADGFKETSEWRSNWDQLNSDYDESRSRLEVMERAEEVGNTLTDEQRSQREAIKRPGIGGTQSNERAAEYEQRSLALSGWVRSGRFQPNENEQRALQHFGIQPGSSSFEFDLFNTKEARSLQRVFRTGHPDNFEQRAMSALVGSLGGYTVAEGFVPSVEKALLEFGSVMSVAEIIRTAQGNDLPWPTSDDTSNEGEQVGEDDEQSEDEISFGRKVLKAYKFTSLPVAVPTELMQDAAISIDQFVGAALGERLGRILNRKFTSGTGAATPHGVETAATSASAESGFAHAGDQLIDLVHAVDRAYRARGSFMCADTVLREIRKVKDANSVYIWRAGLEFGRPDNVLGYPIASNEHMTALDGNDDGVVLFGDMSKYKVRLVQGIRLERDRDIKRDVDLFVAYVRCDGLLLDAGTHPIKKMTVDFTPVA